MMVSSNRKHSSSEAHCGLLCLSGDTVNMSKYALINNESVNVKCWCIQIICIYDFCLFVCLCLVLKYLWNRIFIIFIYSLIATENIRVSLYNVCYPMPVKSWISPWMLHIHVVNSDFFITVSFIYVT